MQDLKQNLKSIGSDLLIHMGQPEEALAGQDLRGHKNFSMLTQTPSVFYHQHSASIHEQRFALQS